MKDFVNRAQNRYGPKTLKSDFCIFMFQQILTTQMKMDTTLVIYAKNDLRRKVVFPMYIVCAYTAYVSQTPVKYL